MVIIMEDYHFVVPVRQGYRWQLHRRRSKVFSTAFMAACNLSLILGVPVKCLRMSWVKPIPRPNLPVGYRLHRLLWHKEKCGWYTRDKRKYCVTPREAMMLGADTVSRRRVSICPGPARHYDGVTWHRAKRAWICQHRNAMVGSYYNSEVEAASALAQRLKCNVGSLKRSHPSAQSRVGYEKRFKQIISCYVLAEDELPDLATLPGDLHDMLCNMPTELPSAIRMIWIQFKYRPYREVLRKAASSYVTTTCSPLKLYKLLVKTAKGLTRVEPEELRMWTANCGKRVARHHGAIPFLSAMKVIKVVHTQKAKVRHKHELLKFRRTDDGTAYAVNLFQECENNLSAWISFANTLMMQSRLSSSAANLEEVCLRIFQIMGELGQMSLPPSYTTGQLAYHVRWLLRCCVLWYLHQEDKLGSLETGKVSVGMLAQAFPDAKAWLRYFARDDDTTVEWLCKKLKYKPSSFLLSMHLCLICDDAVMSKPDGTFNKTSVVVQKIITYYQQHGITPAPHVLGNSLKPGSA